MKRIIGLIIKGKIEPRNTLVFSICLRNVALPDLAPLEEDQRKGRFIPGCDTHARHPRCCRVACVSCKELKARCKGRGTLDPEGPQHNASINVPASKGRKPTIFH